MSTRADMFKRIADAMPQDAEVQEYCAKILANASKSSEKTTKRLDMALHAIKKHAVEPVCAKEFAREVNLQFGMEDDWNTRTAGYYLHQLVLNGVVEEVPYEDKKTGPKMYKYAASTIS